MALLIIMACLLVGCAGLFSNGQATSVAQPPTRMPMYGPTNVSVLPTLAPPVATTTPSSYAAYSKLSKPNCLPMKRASSGVNMSFMVR